MEKTQVIKGKDYRFTVLTDSLIRMEYEKNGNFIDEKTQIIQNRQFSSTNFDLLEDEMGIQIITSQLHLYYKYGEFSPSSLFVEMKANLSDYNNRWTYGDEIETLKGTTQTLDGIDGKTELEDGIISRGGFSILDDSGSYLQLENGEFAENQSTGKDLYFFGYRHEYRRALKDYYKLTGAVPIIPRYALGNWWSRFWPYTEETYLELMNKFKKKKVPLSVSVIDMDWHKREIPERFGSGWTGYSWNREFFPKPERFLKKLHDLGLKTTLNVHPADGIRAFEDAYERISSRLKLNVSLEEPALFDFNNKDFREAYFDEVHHPLEDEGVDFWWIDWQQGNQSNSTGVDPLWALNFYHYLDNQERNEAGLILSRYAGAGSHRYPIGFSGDTIVTWESLDFQPYFTATASNIGYSWWSHDIGGHMKGYSDEELSLRWLQFGVFSPINRLHSSASSFNSKEPWAFSLETEKAMSQIMQFRHAMIPYLYTMNVRNHDDGIPLILPMYYLDSENEKAYEAKNEYQFGSELIVSPITQHTNHQTKLGCVEVWFPTGSWYDLFSGMTYEGNTKMKIYRRKDEMPVFAKSGAILPLDATPTVTKATQLPLHLNWKIFLGKSNQFKLIEDSNGHRAETVVCLDWEKKQLKLEIFDPYHIIPSKRTHIFELIGSGSTVEMKSENSFNEFSLKNITLDKKVDISAELFKRLNQAEIDYQLKEKIIEVFKQEKNYGKRLNELLSLVSGDLLEMLLELAYVENFKEENHG
ncbi:MAG: alpha-xylosidase [Lactobacillales bacterium]|jgi:alpha-glucosidase (family GH31 glycosyl hydrolase)|nr:alpha-xylosidase [Lactobacillales bacterium]